jgi:hypothetical protein
MSGNNHLQNVDEFEMMPFYDDMKDAILEGRKTATTRTKNYLNKYAPWDLPVRDAMMWKNCIIYILWTDVKKMKLGYVRNDHFKEEGFETPEDFEKKWKQIHPRKGYSPLQEVYFHTFKVLEVDTQ